MKKLSKKTRVFLEENHRKLGLPFLSMFPKNCCEIASLILGKVLTDEYPDKKILLIKAEAIEGGRHFWLTAEEKVFDITADQFEEIDSPIIGEPFTPLLKQYKPYELTDIRDELKNNDFGIHLNIFTEISKAIRHEE